MALSLKVPVFFVVTKVDICPDHILRQSLQQLTAILKRPGVKKRPFLVNSVQVCITPPPPPTRPPPSAAMHAASRLLRTCVTTMHVSSWASAVLLAPGTAAASRGRVTGRPSSAAARSALPQWVTAHWLPRSVPA